MRTARTLRRKAARLGFAAAATIAALLLPPRFAVEGAERVGAERSQNPPDAQSLTNSSPTFSSPNNHFVIVKEPVKEQMEQHEYYYLDSVADRWTDASQNGNRQFVTDIQTGESRASDTKDKYRHPEKDHYDVVEVQESLDNAGLHITVYYWSFWPDTVPDSPTSRPHDAKGSIPVGTFDARDEGLPGARRDAVIAIVEALKGFDDHHRKLQAAASPGGR
jgi:hypothetical protein